MLFGIKIIIKETAQNTKRQKRFSFVVVVAVPRTTTNENVLRQATLIEFMVKFKEFIHTSNAKKRVPRARDENCRSIA